MDIARDEKYPGAGNYRDDPAVGMAAGPAQLEVCLYL